MKAIIPAAGRGTRLYPQTYTKPKPLVRVAGKPILGHILDNFCESGMDEVVVVVGVMKDHVVDYVTENYADELDVAFAEQDRTKGLGHCIYQTRSLVEGDAVCIALGDMLFENGFDTYLRAHRSLGDVDGSLGVKRVDDPTSYGIVTLDDDVIVNLEEKPENPNSNVAISGIYFVENTRALFESLAYLIENDVRGAGQEYQLTDALKRMMDEGATLGAFEVGDWYDCGRPETLLQANRHLLGRYGDEDGASDTGVVIPPVDIGTDVEIEQSVVGPNVSVADGATISDSRIRDGIIGEGSRLTDVNLSETIVGDDSTVTGTPTKLNVGDSSEVNL